MASNQEVTKMGEDGKVEVTVNEKPVVLEGAKQTGASVKKTAIEQDVEIKDDFILSIELGGRFLDAHAPALHLMTPHENGPDGSTPT